MTWLKRIFRIKKNKQHKQNVLCDLILCNRLAEEEADRGTRVVAHLLLRPRTESSIRNRYLYKVGANLPGHLGHGGLMVPAHLRS